MSTTVQATHIPTANSRAPSTAANHTHAEPGYTNGHHHHHHHEPVPPQQHTAASAANAMKKAAKKQKATDPSEASKLIAAKISQLELDAAGEKDQEAEIGGFGLFSQYLWDVEKLQEYTQGSGRRRAI